MNGFFKGKTYLLVLIACFLSLLLLYLITYICYKYAVSRKKQKDKLLLSSVDGTVINYDTLRLVYNTSVEAQQTNFPLETSFQNIEYNIPGDGSSSSQSDDSENLLKTIDLVQPTTRSQRIGSKSASEGSEPDEETSNEENDNTRSKLERLSRLRGFGLGRISISLIFNTASATLRVKVIQWHNAGSACVKHAVSPYIKVHLLPDGNTFLTKTKGKENPVFDEEFSFPVGSEDGVKGKTLQLTLCDFDKYSRQIVVATAVVEVEDFLEVLLLPEGTGVLWLDLTEPNDLSSDNKGEVLYSLQHFPTSGRITFALVKAKDLNVEDGDKSIAVKVSLLFGRKIAKTHKISYHQSDMRNPTFNESCVFDIPSDVFEHSSFRLCVYAYSEKKKRLIGKTMSGTETDSTNPVLIQWCEMMTQPRTPALYWHKLV